jgi:hypothetical protein
MQLRYTGCGLSLFDSLELDAMLCHRLPDELIAVADQD